jgi:ferredoxin
MRVLADAGLCIGSGQCVVQAVGVFDQDEESGLVVVLEERPQERLRRKVEAAKTMCPSGAITIMDG